MDKLTIDEIVNRSNIIHNYKKYKTITDQTFETFVCNIQLK